MRPTHAIILNGYKLQGDGADIASVGNDVTKWKHIPIEYDPDVEYSTVSGSCTDLRTWLASVSSATLTLGSDALTFQMVDNGVATNFIRDASVTEAIVLYAGTLAKLQIEVYPGGAARCRLKYLISKDTNLSSSYVRINGITGSGSALNSGRGGSWNGRTSGTLASANTAHIWVLDAVEKFPRGYVASGSNLNLTLHDSSIPEDTSLSTGVFDMSAILSTNLDLTLPAHYQAMLADPSSPVNGATGDVAAVSQNEAYMPTYISMDFWISLNDAVEQVAPLVFLDGYTSEVWEQINPDGVGNIDLVPVEARLLEHAYSWLAAGPRGQLCYGDFPHASPVHDRETDHDAWYRVRFINHYFHITGSWLAFLRTGNPEWYELARIFGNFGRDSSWYLGGKSHSKCLMHWGCCWTLTGHDVDTESVLWKWLVDHDYHALLIHKQYCAYVLTYPYPDTNNFREAAVNVVQRETAYWFTGVLQHKTDADYLRGLLLTAFANAVASSYWTDYRALTLAGPNWHPRWLANNIIEGYDGQNDAGIFNSHHLLLTDDLADKERNGDTPEVSPLGFVKYGKDIYVEHSDGGHYGPGLLGDNLLLQINDIYKYLEDKRLEGGKLQLVYGANVVPTDVCTSIIKFNKTDANPAQLRMLYSSRIPGDLRPTYTFLSGPGIPEYNVLGSGNFVPHYIDITGGSGPIRYYFPNDMKLKMLRGLAQGFQKIVTFTGPVGEYTIRVLGTGTIVYGPMTIYEEWQDIDEDMEYVGYNTKGEWPLEEGILYTPASGYHEPLSASGTSYLVTGDDADLIFDDQPPSTEGTVYIQQSSQPSVLYGVNSAKFKVNVSLVSGSKKKRGNVIHLTKAKTKLSTVFALFDAIVSGIALDAEEFEYVSDDQLLTITNVSGVTGISPSVSAGIYAIPLFPSVDYGVAISTIHLPKLPTATGGV